MGLFYSVNGSIALFSIFADYDLMNIRPADDAPVVLHSLVMAMDGQENVGEANEDFLRMQLIRGHTTDGSGGGAATVEPLFPSTPAAAMVVRGADSTIASAGSPELLWSRSWNARALLEHTFPEALRPKCTQAESTLICRYLGGNPRDVTISVTFILEELR